MKGKGGKAAAANTASSNRTSVSPGAIRKYMVQEGNKGSPGKAGGPKCKTPEPLSKVSTRRQLAETDTNSSSMETREETAATPQEDNQIATKREMVEMFARLEAIIKSEIGAIRQDLGHTLKRVEELEITTDTQGTEINVLKQQIEEIQREQRNLRYRLEDQENRNRRKNLRIRGLPEKEGGKENLQEIIDQIFGDRLDPTENRSKIKLDRAHRVRKPVEIRGDAPRDVIVRFHNFQDKEKIKSSLRANQQVKYGEENLQIFPDLSAETLARRRTLKPLLAHLKANDVQYSWGFPACLIGHKEGRSATLRFPEETQKFCQRLEVPLVEIPGWWEKSETQEYRVGIPAWKPVTDMRRP